ncbi:MAG TPA: long-chain fatty acid--CoA ligase [Bacillota bacterium]
MEERSWHKSYPENIRRSLDYPDVPVYSFLETAARDKADKAALIFLNRQFTYGWLGEQVARLATALRTMGVKQGDRVAIMLPNCPQYVISYYGVLRAGGIVVQTNPLYVERELEFQLVDSGAETIIVLDQLWPRVDKVRRNTPLRRVILTGMADYMPFPLNLLYPVKARKEGHTIGRPKGSGALSFKDVLSRHGASPPDLKVNPAEDTAILQYTGGTTGISKGAMLTHRNLVANAIQCREWDVEGRDAGEVILAALPLFHSYGMTTCMNFGALMKAPVILLPRFNALDAMKAIHRYKVTFFPGAPTMYVALNNHPEVGKYHLDSVRACISGSAPLPVEVQQKFQAITHGRLVEGYGLSESSPVTHTNPIWGKNKIGTIGLPWPDTDCKIVDLETGQKELGFGEVGELCVRGPQVMKGYWNRPDETSKTLREGWLYTGDVATVDEEGYFAIVDRKKDMIIAGGYNIYPREVEEVLFEHPKVLEAAVAGVPDEYRGETVKAYVVVKPGEKVTAEEIIDFCRERMAKYKAPRLVEFRESLPKTMVGKVLRRALVEEEKAKRTVAKPA